MVASKPLRYVGRHGPMALGERLARTGLAGVRLQVARLRGTGPPRLPRTPEQAAERLRRLG
jgi:hypothetical protein